MLDLLNAIYRGKALQVTVPAGWSQSVKSILGVINFPRQSFFDCVPCPV